MIAQVMIYSIIFAGIIGLFIMLWRRETIVRMRRVFWKLAGSVLWKQSIRSTEAEHQQFLTFPFMTAVLPGVAFCYFFIT